MTIKFFNDPPYYDDFDETKNYLRVLFRPGNAVQARELTQMQTALQAQIDRHGKHIFKEGTPVLGGNMSLDIGSDFVKLESSFYPSNNPTVLTVSDNYIDELLGSTITGQTTGVTAIVIDIAEYGASETPTTLYVKYLNSGDDGVTKVFLQEEELISSVNNRRVKVLTAAATPIGKGTRFSIATGVFFVNGNFVYTPAGSLILSRYATDPSIRVVYEISESIITSSEDISLSDNALGTPNEAAPGAHRYQILLNLITQPFDFDVSRVDNMIQLMAIESGNVKSSAVTEYSELASTLAKRTYEESGNYAVKPFILNMRELYNDGANNGLYTAEQIQAQYTDINTELGAQTYAEQRLAIGLEKSVAYVNGYRIELQDIKYINLLKSRETSFFNGASVVAPVGNYVYVDVTQSLPDIDNFTTLNLRNVGTAIIGTARARSIEKVSGTLHKLYLFDIKMNGGNVFTAVRTIRQTLTQAAEFQATLNATYGYRVYEQDLNSVIFPLPFSTVKTLLLNELNDTFYISKKTFYNYAVTGSTAVLSSTNGIFQTYNPADWIVTNQSTGAAVTIANVALSYNTGNQTSTATITFSAFASGQVNIIAPLQKNLTRKTKTLNEDYIGTITTPNTVGGNYDSLGVTDILKLNYIKDLGVPLSGGEFLDITNRYEIDDGQRENFYDIGRIRLKPGANAPIGQIEYSLNHFLHSSGDYFSVDSYSINYEDIPGFQSIKGAIALRDAIDFRPTKDNTGNDFTGVSSSTLDMIKPGSIIQMDIVYYLNRIDKVYVNKYGTFGIQEGVPALNPSSPRDPQDSMVLYELYVGSYTFGPESIIPRMVDNKRYTMRDIGRLEGRIKNLEYYTTLSLLEKETADYQLPTNSFKNGFIVDSFHGHNIGNPSHPDYSCSIDKARGILRPQFVEDECRLLWYPSGSTGVRQTGPLLTLDYSEVSYISQPYASLSEFVNPYNVFTWAGDLKLSPESDNWKDTESRPDVVIDQEGVYDSFKALADATGVTGTVWNEWQTNWSGVVPSSLTTSNATSQATTSATGVSTVGRTTNTTITNTTTTTNVATTIGTVQTNLSRSGMRTEVVPDTVTTNLGERVVEVNFIPFMRSRIVAFKAERMKPNTRVYAFFDGTNITNFATKATQFHEFSKTTGPVDFRRSRIFNGRTSWPTTVQARVELVTDSAGELNGFFLVPNISSNRFRTGARTFRLADNDKNIRNNTTTFSEAVYEASGLLESRENVILSTRVPVIERTAVGSSQTTFDRGVTLGLSTTQSSASTSSTTSVTAPEPRNLGNFFGWFDPLAQTIMVDEPGGIFTTSIDLYFATYDPTGIPVSIHLVTTSSGIPSINVIPFSRVSKVIGAGDVSEDASVATRFTFEAPIHLQQNVEYAVVIVSMSDIPRVYVSEMGEYDLTNPTYRITQQPYLGSFFKSQNASTWTPEQTKDLKFVLNRASFVTTPATMQFRNVDPQPRSGLRMGADPLYTTNGSTLVKVYHKNHGLFEGSFATLENVEANATSFMNGIPITELNGNKLISRVERDAYWINSTTVATSTGRAGGSNVSSHQNILMNSMHFAVQELVVPGTAIDWTSRTSKGQSLAGAEIPYERSAFFPIIPNETTYFNRIQCIPTLANETDSVPGLDMVGTMATSTNFLSPIVDLDRVSVYAISNIIDNPTDQLAVDNTNYIENYVADTVSKGASGDCKYVTKLIQIVGEANSIRVLLSVNRPSGTDIKLYFKVQAAEDTTFEELPWVLQQPDDIIGFDENPNAYSEIEYSIDDELAGAEFTNMAFKIVLTSSNSAYVPTVKDFRAIAFNQ